MKYNIGYFYVDAVLAVVVANLILICAEMAKNVRKSIRKRKYYREWGKHYKKIIFDYAQRKELRKQSRAKALEKINISTISEKPSKTKI